MKENLTAFGKTDQVYKETHREEMGAEKSRESEIGGEKDKSPFII